MHFSFFIALRYLLAKRKQVFISVVTVISILGVMLGTMALIIVISVLGGLEDDLRDKILGANAHLVVLSHQAGMADYAEKGGIINAHPDVLSAAPFIFSQAMARSSSNLTGVVIKGIDPETVGSVLDLKDNMVEGSLEGLEGTLAERVEPGIIIGDELARNLNLSLNKALDIISPLGDMTPLGMIPRTMRFVVKGIFKSGMYEYDSSFVYIHLSEAQRFFNMGDVVTGIEAKIKDIYEASRVAREISSILGYNYYTRTWMDMNQNIFHALKLEKIAMFIILLLIILVASFGIFSTLYMMVMEKGRDIGILKAMGARRKDIMRIFIWEGVIIGLSGIILGLLGGYLSCLLLKKYRFIELPPDVYYISTLPVKMDVAVFALVAVAALIICIIATLYPSWRASRLEPVEALRYE